MVEDWLALIGNMNGATRELRQATRLPHLSQVCEGLRRKLREGHWRRM
jgi:hypothetical protein